MYRGVEAELSTLMRGQVVGQHVGVGGHDRVADLYARPLMS